MPKVQGVKMGSCTSRRTFLKKGAAGLAGAAFLSTGACSSKSSKSSRENPRAARKKVYRTLGKTGLKLPVVSMGSVYELSLVRTALDEGIVYLHTSSGYSERNHERMLGEILRDLPRDSFVVATGPELPYEYGRRNGRSLDVGTKADPAHISKSLEGSLQCLGLEYIDIYYLLSVGTRRAALFEPYMKEFERLKKDGLVRFVGIGTHENEPEVIRSAVESDFWEVVLTAYNFRQTYRDEIESAIRQAAGAGLGIVAMKTQAGVYWNRATRRMINMKAALKWVLQNENVHTTIPAFSNFDEMREDLSVMEDLKLTPDERRDLRLGDDLGYSGCYCQCCGRCLSQCPEGVDIPRLMRACMYALAYGDPQKARDTLGARRDAYLACASCEECDVDCALGLDVKAGALDLSLMLEDSKTLLV